MQHHFSKAKEHVKKPIKLVPIKLNELFYKYFGTAKDSFVKDSWIMK